MSKGLLRDAACCREAAEAVRWAVRTVHFPADKKASVT